MSSKVEINQGAPQVAYKAKLSNSLLNIGKCLKKQTGVGRVNLPILFSEIGPADQEFLNEGKRSLPVRE